MFSLLNIYFFLFVLIREFSAKSAILKKTKKIII